MVALSSWIEKEQSAAADSFSRPGEPPPLSKNRIRRFFSDSPDRVGESAPQVVDRVGETGPFGYDSRLAPSLARSNDSSFWGDAGRQWWGAAKGAILYVNDTAGAALNTLSGGDFFSEHKPASSNRPGR